MIDRRRFLKRCAWCVAGLAAGGVVGRAALDRVHAVPPRPSPSPDADPLGLGLERWSRSVCDLCGLGEPVFLGVRGGRPAAVKGIPLSTTGFGRLCPRARALVAASITEDRAVTPMIRRDPSTKGTLQGLEPASWDEALARAARGIQDARERLGPDGVAVFASDGETCETYGLLGRVARAGLGIDSIDSPARLDALHAFEACRAMFGAPANPACVDDVDAAGLVVLVGGDVAETHPGLFLRVLDARRAGRARVVLVDARKTEAAAVADVHVRPRPGGELALVHALAARVAGGAGAPPGAEAWLTWLRGARPATVPGRRAPLAPEPGASRRSLALDAALREAAIDRAQVDAVESRWRATRSVVTLVGPTALGSAGGSALARAVAQLHRATGQWGAAGRGVLFLPRGANATGEFAAGMAPGMLPAGRRLVHAGERATIADAWGAAPERMPEKPGLPALEWPAAVRAGRMGAFLVHRANPAAEMPGALEWRDALRAAFVVATTTHVPSETTVFADVVLPVAMVAGESAGTLMTLDRRCEALEAGARPPGQARTADRIVADLARLLLPGDLFERLVGSSHSSFAEWDRWRALAAGTPFEAGGISVTRLGRELGIAWPCPAEDDPGCPRIGTAHLAGEASAATAPFAPTPAPAGIPAADAGRPFLLVVGPLREHGGSRVRTGRTPELHYEAPSARLEMHPTDGAASTLADGEWVTVESSAGAATMRLWLTDRTMPGVVFLPEHYGFLSDLQGGSAAQKEPEGLAHRLTTCDLVSGADAPAGLRVAVAVRKARRRDMRQRGIDASSLSGGA